MGKEKEKKKEVLHTRSPKVSARIEKTKRINTTLGLPCLASPHSSRFALASLSPFESTAKRLDALTSPSSKPDTNDPVDALPWWDAAAGTLDVLEIVISAYISNSVHGLLGKWKKKTHVITTPPHRTCAHTVDIIPSSLSPFGDHLGEADRKSQLRLPLLEGFVVDVNLFTLLVVEGCW